MSPDTYALSSHGGIWISLGNDDDIIDLAARQFWLSTGLHMNSRCAARAIWYFAVIDSQ